MIIELNNFNRTIQNVEDIAIGSDVLEVWSGDVVFESSVKRASYFKSNPIYHCVIVSVVDNNQYRFAFDDEYVDDQYPITSTLPTDTELYQILQELMN